VTEVATLRHLGRVRASRGGEFRGQPERGETMLAPHEVDVGEDILFERLDALPHARLCIKCKAKEEDGKRR
jgi:hypothetical protein